MPANRYGIDLGEVYSTAANLKRSREAGQMNQFKLRSMQREEDAIPAAEALNKRRNALRATAAGGGEGAEGAIRELAGFDPEGAQEIVDLVSGMDETQAKKYSQNLESIGQYAGHILQGRTPEEQASRYAAVAAELKQAKVDGMPKVYNQGWVQMQLARAMAADEVVTEEFPNIAVQKFGDEDIMFTDGVETDRTKSATKPVKGAGAGGGKAPSSADYSLVARQVAQAFDGEWDEATGSFKIKDTESRNRYQSVSRMAAQLLRERKAESPLEAAAMALEKFGIALPESMNNNDPLGMRG
jgi:hypothetical protein